MLRRDARQRGDRSRTIPAPALEPSETVGGVEVLGLLLQHRLERRDAGGAIAGIRGGGRPAVVERRRVRGPEQARGGQLVGRSDRFRGKRCGGGGGGGGAKLEIMRARGQEASEPVMGDEARRVGVQRVAVARFRGGRATLPL